MRRVPLVFAALVAFVAAHTAAEQIRVSLAGPNSVYITWTSGTATVNDGDHTVDVTPRKSPVQPCVQHGSASRRLRFHHTTSAVSHTYAGSTRGQWTGTFHTALVTGVAQNVRWAFRVGDCQTAGQWSGVHTVRIPSVPKDGNVGAFSDRMVNLIVFGDQGVGPHSTVTAASMGAAVLKGDVDAVLHVGDFGYNLPDPQQRNWDLREDWYVNLKQRTWDYWSRMMEPVTSSTLYMTLPGNHETTPFDLDFKPLKHRFPMPNTALGFAPEDTPQALLGLLQDDDTASIRLFYSFDMGSLHVVMLNTESDVSPGSAQRTWLAADLAAVDRTVTSHIIVCGHRPMYSSAKKDGSNLLLRASLEPLLIKHRVSMVIAGHDHSYERTVPIREPDARQAGRPSPVEAAKADGDDNNWEGTVHVRIATGGITHLSKWRSSMPPAWSAYREAAFGYGRLSLLATGALQLDFVKKGAEGDTPGDREELVVDTVVVPAPVRPAWAVAQPEPLAGMTVDKSVPLRGRQAQLLRPAATPVEVSGDTAIGMPVSEGPPAAATSYEHALKTLVLVALLLVAAQRVWGTGMMWLKARRVRRTMTPVHSRGSRNGWV